MDTATQLLCMTRRNQEGTWNGYVLVPKGHPWWSVDYSELEDQVTVHGGLTFSGSWFEEGDWWLGFDHGHYYDTGPLDLVLDQIINSKRMEKKYYRDLPFVRGEVTRLAQQISSHPGKGATDGSQSRATRRYSGDGQKDSG